MRIHALMVTGLLLGACSGETAETASAEFVTANGTGAGTYEVSSPTGDVSIVTINSDGTYSQMTPDGGNAAEGTLEVVDDKTCFKVRRAGATALCYSETEPDENGAYTATTETGLELTVRPYAATAESGARLDAGNAGAADGADT